ncbi:MAG: ABC transporter ATP-binding protein [Bacteroidota bacterium]
MNSMTNELPTQKPMPRLFNFLGNYKKETWVSVLASVTNKVFDLMPPFLTAWLIDTVSNNTPAWIPTYTGLNDPWSVSIFIAILIIVIFGFESYFEWVYKKGFMKLAQLVQHDLRSIAYSKLQHRELAYFENNRTGNLMAIMNDDVNQLERFLNNSFNEIIQLITLFIVGGWSLFALSPLLGAIGMFPIPFIIWGSIYYQKKVAPYYQNIRKQVGLLGARLENNIGGIFVIKSFQAHDFEQKRVEKASIAYREANFDAIKWSAIYVPLIRMFIAFGLAITLLIGAYWVIYEPSKFSIGGLAFFAMMIQKLLWPITRLGSVFDEYERAKASAKRIFGLIDSNSAIQNIDQPKSLKLPIESIDLDHVEFSYVTGQPILQNLKLHIKGKQKLGIAGPTGGGKTTLIKLLLRFYDITNGNIKINGTDIRDYAIHELRKLYSIVSQDVYLFHGSVKENIAYGMPEASMETIISAAKKAKLHDFIVSLPDQYDSLVGERGIKLSGGQRQRLSIARAILKDAPILILDEATSAVDTETERAIHENLNQLTENKTAIIIAHRLSTIRHADKIIVLKDGQLVEEGNHEELLAKDGQYADLWKVQTGMLKRSLS